MPSDAVNTAMHADKVITRIETRGILPDGRVRGSWNSYPLGTTMAEYERIDAAMVRAYGVDRSRTDAYYTDSRGEGAIRSEQTRRTDRLVPLPCIACGTQLDSAANDPSFDHVPYAGTMFSTGGHYGSTAFDSFDGHRLQIVVCDDCLRGHAAARVRIVAPDGAMKPWDGHSDGESGPADDELVTEDEASTLTRPVPPILIGDARGKFQYVTALARIAASRGTGDAHVALAAVLTAAGAAFARNFDAWQAAMENAVDAAKRLPMVVGTPAEVLTRDELAELRVLIERLHANIAADDDPTPAQSDARLRDIAAFDILILSQTLSRGERTTYREGETEDVVDRLTDAMTRTDEERLITTLTDTAREQGAAGRVDDQS